MIFKVFDFNDKNCNALHLKGNEIGSMVYPLEESNVSRLYSAVKN